MAENGSSLDVVTPVGSLKIPVGGDGANNVLTALTCIMVCVIAWALWTHGVDSKESTREAANELKISNREVVAALRDGSKGTSDAMNILAQAIREQNCLLASPEIDRVKRAEDCKRVAR